MPVFSDEQYEKLQQLLAESQKNISPAKVAPQQAQLCCPLLAAGGPLAPKPWRKRHPLLFWGFIVFLLFGVVQLLHSKLPADFGGVSQGQNIGIVRVEGMILDSKEIVEWTNQLINNDSIKGIVVYINSPGGAVGPSQEIYNAIKRASLRKTVIVSMGGVAASGGYYAALGGQEIFAGPSTLTGSIGVILEIPNFEELLKTVGISSKTIATGGLKGAGSTTRPMTEEEETYFKGLLHDMFDEFITTIAINRKLSVEEVRKIADGRALTGRQALQLGLIDTLGDITDAQLRVKELCGLEKVEYLVGPKKQHRWLNELMESVLEFSASVQKASTEPRFMYR